MLAPGVHPFESHQTNHFHPHNGDSHIMKTNKNKSVSLFIAATALSFSVGCAGAQNTSSAAASGEHCGQLNAHQVVSQLYTGGAVYDAHPIQERVFRARALQPNETLGASLYVKAEPGLTSPYLQRVMSCHVASGQPAHPNDPLFPQSGKIAQLKVREAKHGFAVDVRAEKPAVGREIWQRAQSITAPAGAVHGEQLATAVDDSPQL
ncbi:MAG TPA: hypothetical protein VN764_08535 [Polyangiaceae bacterium]|nr:hypothetical protein [Polyangiaceae bacterium]